MIITSIRDTFKPTFTYSRLYVDNKFECFVLEDTDRYLEKGFKKVYGETAIPIGEYEITMTFSQRFQQMMPLINGVPQFEGIRIHPGNDEKATHGCLLVGNVRSSGKYKLLDSKSAYIKLKAKIQAAIDKKEKVMLRIVRLQ
jgi:hypothetical protein